MPIARPEIAVLLCAALMLPSPALAQAVNPLAGDTQAAQQGSFGAEEAPANERGKLLPEPASGGQVFTDELGWYRFTMANGGETSLDGDMRTFRFESGGQNAACFAIRIPNNAFANFTMEQIQAELDTLYEPFDASVTANGATVLKRESLQLDAAGQRNGAPLKVLGWDTRDDLGNLVTYTLAPVPAGQLMFACAVGSADHAREIVQRYFRLAEGVTIPGK